MIYGQCRARRHVLVVHIGHNAHDATGRRADVDELHDRIRPLHVPVNRFLVGEHPLRQALAHDHDPLTVSPVGIVEIATGNDRDTERREKPGRDRT